MKGPSLIFRIQRHLSFLLKGIGKKEMEHYLFTLQEEIQDINIYSRLAWHNWTPNYMGYLYKGQIYQCRRLVNGGRYQYHIRFYSDGKVTGHFETAPEYDISDHLSGIELRIMNKREAERLYNQITGIERLVRRFGR